MANKSVGLLTFTFGANMKSFERAMNKAQKKLAKFSRNVTKTGKNLTMGLTLPIAALGFASLKAFNQQAKAQQKLLVALNNSVSAQQKLIKQAKELQELTLFGDEETIEAQSMLAMMGLQENAILKLTPLIQDMAAAKGMDLVTAADLVAKSLGSTTNALSRYGITITGAVGSSERLSTALTELETKFGGQAEAMAEVGTGSLEQLKNQLGDLGEQLGERLMPHVEKLTEWAKSAIKWFDDLDDETKDSIVTWGLLAAALGPVLITVGRLAAGFKALIGIVRAVTAAMSANPWLLVAAAIIAVGVAAYKLVERFNHIAKAQNAINDANKEAMKMIADQQVFIDEHIRTIKDETTSLDQKKAALDKLKQAYPDYYGDIELTGFHTKRLDIATENLNSTLLKTAKIEAYRQKLKDLANEMVDLEIKMKTGQQDWTTFLMENITPASRSLSGIMEAITGQSLQEGLNEADKAGIKLTQKLITELLDKAKKDLAEDGLPDISLTDWMQGKVTGGTTKDLSTTNNDLKKVSNTVWTLVDGFNERLKQYNRNLKESGLQMFGDIVANSFHQADMAQENFFDVFLENLKQSIKQLLVQLVILSAIKALMGGGVSAFSLASLKITLGDIMGVPFANGGLVTGPTTALIGEGSGTSASNPEVVAPLDKLKSMIGGNEIVVTGQIKGNDIYLSNKKTSFNRHRTT